jgi:hypothetical protein
LPCYFYLSLHIWPCYSCFELQIFPNLEKSYKIEKCTNLIPIFCKMLLILSSFLWAWIYKLCLAGKIFWSRMIGYICMCDLALLISLWNACFLSNELEILHDESRHTAWHFGFGLVFFLCSIAVLCLC